MHANVLARRERPAQSLGERPSFDGLNTTALAIAVDGDRRAQPARADMHLAACGRVSRPRRVGPARNRS
jgi:hypothetical protein